MRYLSLQATQWLITKLWLVWPRPASRERDRDAEPSGTRSGVESNLAYLPPWIRLRFHTQIRESLWVHPRGHESIPDRIKRSLWPWTFVGRKNVHDADFTWHEDCGITQPMMFIFDREAPGTSNHLELLNITVDLHCAGDQRGLQRCTAVAVSNSFKRIH